MGTNQKKRSLRWFVAIHTSWATNVPMKWTVWVRGTSPLYVILFFIEKFHWSMLTINPYVIPLPSSTSLYIAPLYVIRTYISNTLIWFLAICRRKAFNNMTYKILPDIFKIDLFCFLQYMKISTNLANPVCLCCSDGGDYTAYRHVAFFPSYNYNLSPISWRNLIPEEIRPAIFLMPALCVFHINTVQ